jgi:ABC-type nitrate/sulfonate/bicarbonate transport system ATPase subunit
MSNDLLVRVEKLIFEGETHPLIEGLTMRVAQGSVASILGPTGAGKTTLMRVIAGLEKHYVGSISLGGVEVTRPSRAIQVIFQDYRLLPWKTVEGNLRFAAPDRMRKEDVKIRIANRLTELELIGIAKRWPKGLSGGQRAGVAFARAFMDPPKVLLLDEPFSGMDLRRRYELQDRLTTAAINRNTTLIVVSHSVEDAVYLSDTVFIFRKDPFRVEAVIDIEKPRGTRDHLDHALHEKQREITECLLRASRYREPSLS